jgi:plasmid maintenance system antidote protein VapI
LSEAEGRVSDIRTHERFWLNLQASYDLEVERDRLGDRLEKEVEAVNISG